MSVDALFSRRLLVVSGKGGVGKTTVAASIASLAARSGKNVLLICTDGRGDAAALFGKVDHGYDAIPLEPRLHGMTSDFEPLLADFVRTVVPLGFVADRILGSSVFRYFTRATPGLPDLLLLGKVWHTMEQQAKGKRKKNAYDLFVIDAPATGHALSLVGIPRTLVRTIPPGPLRKMGTDLDTLLADPERTLLVVVAEPAELAAREAEEMVSGARDRAGLATGLLVENRIGRSGAAETVPRLDLPSVRIDEIDPDEAADEPAFFAAFRDALAGEKRIRRASARTAPPLPEDTLDAAPWLLESRLLVLAGPGGVGKTSLAAAAGLAAARRGRRVLVMTVDPARRLMQALGIDGLGDRPTEVPLGGPSRGGRGGSLMAMQIDPKATFERLLPRIASPEAVDKIRRNRLYAGLVDSLPGVVEYMGVEALSEHAADPDLDLIVLDTPPAARGLDFLEAPDRMVALLENDALRWFLRGDSLLGRALSGASRGAAAVLRLADKALGFSFLSDLAEFFHAFDGLYDGFRERSRATSAELRKGKFLVVSSLDRSALLTAAQLAGAFTRKGTAPGLLLNRVSPRGAARFPLPRPLDRLPYLIFPESTLKADLLSSLADRMLPR